MHLSTIVPAFLAALASASPATPAANVKLFSMTRSVSARGTIGVPLLSASASVISATATVDSSGQTVAAQLIVNAAGSGPGVCAQGQLNTGATLTDSCGTRYNLLCGYDIMQQGDLFSEFAPSWSSCVNRCNQVDGCDAVLFSKAWSSCYFKTLNGLGAPQLQMDSDRVFAYKPGQLEAPFKSATYTVPVTTILPNPFAISTTVIPAAGLVSIPSMPSGTAVEATATLSAGDLLNLNVKIRWK